MITACPLVVATPQKWWYLLVPNPQIAGYDTCAGGGVLGTGRLQRTQISAPLASRTLPCALPWLPLRMALSPGPATWAPAHLHIPQLVVSPVPLPPVP
jgi:hypothetical protein